MRSRAMSSLGGYVSQHLSNKWTEDSKKMPSPTGPLGSNGILGRTRSRSAWLCRLRDAPQARAPTLWGAPWTSDCLVLLTAESPGPSGVLGKCGLLLPPHFQCPELLLCRKVDALPASGVPRYLHIPPPRAQGMNHVSSPHHLLPHQDVCDSRPCRVADSSGIPQSVPRKEGESLGEAEARPSLWWVCVQKPGLTKPGHRAVSCRADLSKTFFMPPKSQTTL